MGGQRGLLAIIGGILLLLVATVVIVLVRGDAPAASYPAGSPEAAFQAYLAAWEAGDDDAAFASFSSEIRAATSAAAYHRQATEMRQQQAGSSRRVYIDSASIRSDAATLELTVETSSISGLSANRYRQSQAVTMTRQDGTWKLDRLWMGTEPWFVEKL